MVFHILVSLYIFLCYIYNRERFVVAPIFLMGTSPSWGSVVLVLVPIPPTWCMWAIVVMTVFPLALDHVISSWNCPQCYNEGTMPLMCWDLALNPWDPPVSRSTAAALTLWGGDLSLWNWPGNTPMWVEGKVAWGASTPDSEVWVRWGEDCGSL